MLVLLFPLYFALAGVDALPLELTRLLSEPSTPRDIDGERSLADIVKSCLATILACTWVSLHLNMPSPQSGKLAQIWERVQITLLALLVPEWILGWAICQWGQAGELVCQLKDKQTSGGTGDPQGVSYFLLRLHPIAYYSIQAGHERTLSIS